MRSYRSRLPLGLRVRVSVRTVAAVLAKPWVLGVGVLTTGLVLGMLLWLPNFGLLVSSISDTAMGVQERLAFAGSAYGSLFVNNSVPGGVVLVVFAALSGINLALLAYVVSSSARQAASSGVANLGAILAASVGAGCAACGTSFLAPLVGGLVGTAASITLTRELGVLANGVATTHRQALPRPVLFSRTGKLSHKAMAECQIHGPKTISA
jgi:hypothetical protein